MTFTGLQLRYGLVVRIAGSHPAGPGSIPGNGILLFFPLWHIEVDWVPLAQRVPLSSPQTFYLS